MTRHALVTSLVLWLATAPLMAQVVTIESDRVIDASSSLPASAILVRDGVDGPTRVELIDGGQLSTEVSALSEVIEQSSLSITGGEFGGQIGLSDSGHLDLRGGRYVFPLANYPGNMETPVVRIADQASVEMDGGEIALPVFVRGRGIQALDRSRIQMLDGTIRANYDVTIELEDRARLDLFGGEISNSEHVAIDVRDFAQLAMSGGIVKGGEDGIALRLRDRAQATITGGTIVNDRDGGVFVAQDDSWAYIESAVVQGRCCGIQSLDRARITLLDNQIGSADGGLRAGGESRILAVDSQFEISDGGGVSASEAARVGLVGVSVLSPESSVLHVDGNAVVDLWQTTLTSDDSLIVGHVSGNGILNVRSAVLTNLDPAGLSLRISQQGTLRVFGMELTQNRNRIQGVFRDGTPVDLTTELQDNGRIELINLLDADFDLDGTLQQRDIDLLSQAVRAGSLDPTFDLDQSGQVDAKDVDLLVFDYLGTAAGDANLDLRFDSSDLVTVFGAGLYETGLTAGWATGDWNHDALFNSSDLVAALQTGNYLGASAPAARAVPEPSAAWLIGLGCIGSIRLLSQRRARPLRKEDRQL